MSILVACKCGREFQVHDQHAGRRLTCPSCHESVLIPGGDGKRPDTGDDEWNAVPSGTAKRPRQGLRRFPWGVAILVLLLIAGGVSIAVYWRQLWSWVGDSGPSVEELALVPPDAQGFVSLRLADWWRSSSGQAVRKEINRKNPAVLKAWEKRLGLPPEEIERVIFVVDNRGGHSEWAIVTSVKPYDRNRVKKTILALALEVKMDSGRSYFRSQELPGDALYFFNERIFLVGGESAIDQFLKRPPSKASGPLSDALRLVAEDHLLVCGMSQPGLGLPPGLDDLVPKDFREAFQDCKSAALTAREGDAIGWDLRLSFHNEAEAKAFAEAARPFLAAAREALPFLKNDPLGAIDEDTKKLLESALSNVTLEPEGTSVRVKTKTSQEPVAALFVRFLETAMPQRGEWP
jgi:hypothetical protein